MPNKRKIRRNPQKKQASRKRTSAPKKSLGQNFLTSEKIAEEIVQAASVGPDDVVLEVGPGKGILTETLLKKTKKVIAVEKDRRLVEFLREKFSDRKKPDVVNADILKFNPGDYGLKNNGYKLVANIPYYITSHFLRKFLESDFQPSSMVLMVQKEVAERVVGLPVKPKKKNARFRPLKESILSVSVKVYGEPKIIRTVSASYFSPKPKVDSAVLLIDNISKKFFKDGVKSGEENDGKAFFEILKKGFSEKRKMLKNNLPEFTAEDFAKCEIPPKARAENLSPENWRCLSLISP